MLQILHYIESVVKRNPKTDRLALTDASLLAHDIKYDVEHNKLSFEDDAALLRHVDISIRCDEQRVAFRKFKRNYQAWLKQHGKATIKGR